jgi:hypothetical protein
MKKKLLTLAVLALAAALALALTGCRNPIENYGNDTYTVSFTPGEGSGITPPSQTVTFGTLIMLPGQGGMIAPFGKIFTGWTMGGGPTYPAGTSYNVTSNVTFTARWDPSYTVIFSAGDGSGTAPASQTVASGTSITLPNRGGMTAPPGKTFTGWTMGGQNYTAGASYTVTSNVTFTARWIDSGGVYTVSFTPGGGSGTAPDSRSAEIGESITLPSKEDMIAPAGKAFDGWTWAGQTYPAGVSYTPTSDVTLTARWIDSGGGTDPFAGTWVNVQSSGGVTVTTTVTASGGEYEQKLKLVLVSSGSTLGEAGLTFGTYTFSGTTVTMTSTKMNLNILKEGLYPGVTYSEDWRTFEELPTEYQAEPWEPSVITITGGNTFTINAETYIKTGG